METGRQGTTLFTAICLLIAVLVIIQLWLLGAALDAALSGEPRLAVPASLASAALFAVNAALLWYVFDFDRRRRKVDPHA
jgi:membrane protein implicated in regulation of membrane protease activity